MNGAFLPFLMAATLQGIDRTATCADCSECDGGTARFALTDICCIADITIDANRRITGITMTTAGAGGWANYVHDDDDTAFLSQVGEQISVRQKRFNVSGFGKFACPTVDIEDEVDRISQLCTPVALVEKSNGDVKLIGIDIVSDGAGGYTWKKSKTQLSMLASVFTGTGAEEDRIEFNFTATHRKVAATTLGFTIDDAIAL